MRKSAPGSNAFRRVSRSCSGFTLIELMIVVALIALASSVVSLALRDPSISRLEQEGARLAALLESARAEARSSGLPAQWFPRSADQPGLNGTNEPGADFRFVGLPASSGLPRRWLNPGVAATVIGAAAVTLGPEPIIGAQKIILSLDDRRLTLTTDGLGPFTVEADPIAPVTR
jgi:general secretion pathway protein H